jgi:Beta propeller domain
MSEQSRARVSWILIVVVTVAACSHSGDDESEQPLNIDYSALKLADAVDTPLLPAGNDRALLEALRNGVRLSLDTATAPVIFASLAGISGQQYSGTTVQVDGVDEPDVVKYNGRYLYTVEKQATQGALRTLLRIARTDSSSATFEHVSEFEMDTGLGRPVMYLVGPAGGATEHVAFVSSAYYLPATTFLAGFVPPQTTLVRLIDVRDPRHPQSSWKLELQGSLQASRKIGNMLYIVTTHWPRLPGIVTPADSIEKREANERLIRAATSDALLPFSRENDGPPRVIPRPGDCFTIADVAANDAYAALVTITAIDLERRRISDAACLNTNVLGIYVSKDSVYVGGEGGRLSARSPFTVLHKFALEGSSIVYRATGAVSGTIGWRNGSYFMDELEGDLRILSSQADIHLLSVLREVDHDRLATIATLPNEQRPERIGKPDEQVQAVRFAGKRAYIVTFRRTDPLYALDLSNPLDPRIAGQLEMPGFSTYLGPIGDAAAELLLSVGQAADASGLNQGLKVELFDVRDIAQPRSLGAHEFGIRGSYSEALDDPHALATLRLANGNYRVGVPGTIYTASPYSGVHLLEVTGASSAAPQLNLHGIIKTSEVGGTTPFPKPSSGMRSILHAESVFVVQGDSIVGTLWDDIR